VHSDWRLGKRGTGRGLDRDIHGSDSAPATSPTEQRVYILLFQPRSRSLVDLSRYTRRTRSQDVFHLNCSFRMLKKLFYGISPLEDDGRKGYAIGQIISANSASRHADRDRRVE
jgi:hypothetical protein